MSANDLPLSVAEQLLYTTLRISAVKDGLVTSRGTGFFYNFEASGPVSIPALITNKHVVEGSEQLKVTCHKSAGTRPSGEFFECNTVTDGNVVFHPDPNVDLCALLFGPILNQVRASGQEVFFRGLSKDVIPQQEDWAYFDAIEQVTMIGCPRGIIDEANNLPVVRRGITATPLANDYERRPEFMVDMACFPGSSGSPVFLLDQFGYHDRKTNSYNMGAGRLHLVGILYSGPQVTNQGQIVMTQPATVQVASMMHLGNAVKATEIHKLQDALNDILDSNS